MLFKKLYVYYTEVTAKYKIGFAAYTSVTSSLNIAYSGIC